MTRSPFLDPRRGDRFTLANGRHIRVTGVDYGFNRCVYSWVYESHPGEVLKSNASSWARIIKGATVLSEVAR